jgi:hypothetical protein
MENQTLKNPDLKNEDVQTLMKSLTHEGYEGWESVREMDEERLEKAIQFVYVLKTFKRFCLEVDKLNLDFDTNMRMQKHMIAICDILERILYEEILNRKNCLLGE